MAFNNFFNNIFGKKAKEVIQDNNVLEKNETNDNENSVITDKKNNVQNENEVNDESCFVLNEDTSAYSNLDYKNKEIFTSSDENISLFSQNDSTQDLEEVPNNSIFSKFKSGLIKTSNSFTDKFDKLFKGCLKIDDDLYEELEELLITSDISYKTSLKIVDKLKENIKKKNINDVNLIKSELKTVIKEILSTNNSDLNLDNKDNIIVVVGVNGVGKTTTIGKLATKFHSDNKKVLLAAGDTFRAAAEDQLEIWANKAGVDIVRHHQEGADPSAVIFDAIKKAKNSNTNVLICDTAGRLHNKVNLMNELSKIIRIIDKEYPEANKEILLVIDATTGQNALNQVKIFNEAVDLTGIILTKLDGTAKGGIVISIVDEFNIPIKFVGIGEKSSDLQKFSPEAFSESLF